MNPFRRKTTPTPLASARIPDIPFDALPPAIARTLRKAASRIRRIVVLRGVLAVLATAVAAILCSMAVDAMVALVSPAVRWAMWGLGVAATAFAAHSSLVRPLSRKLTPARLAALLERNHPELEERLSTVVELMAAPDSLAEGSEELMKVVVDAAVADAGGLSPAREFTARTVRPRLAAAAVGLGVLGILFAVWPKSAGRLFARAVAPSARIDNLYASSLRVAPGDATVLEGTPFSVELAILGGFPGQAYVLSRPASGPGRETSERMTQTTAERGSDGVSIRHYRHLIGSADRSFLYRVRCGSAVTRPYAVTVVPEPSWTNLLIELDYPDYTGAPPRLQGDDDPDVSAVAGTRVSLSVLPSRPLHGALELAGGPPLPAEPDPETGLLSWAFDLTNGLSGAWSVSVWDDNGFSNAPVAHAVQVVPDAMPELAFATPTNLSLTLPPYATVPLVFTASDDFGVGVPSLEASIDGGAWKPLRELSLAETPMEGLWAGKDELRLGRLDLDGKSAVRFRIVADDNFPEALGGPHHAVSPVVSVRLDGAARTLGLQRLEAGKKNADRRLDDMRRELDRARASAEEALRKAEAGQDPPALEKVLDTKERIVKAEDAARALAAETERGALDALAPEAKAMLEARIAPAHEAADEAAAASPEDRPAEIRRAIEKIDEAKKAVDAMQESVRETYEELKKTQEMSTLADRQSDLAVRAEKDLDKSDLESWSRKQDELREQMEARAKEMAEKDPFAAEREKAESLGKDYDRLSSLQEKLAKLREELADADADRRRSAEEQLRDLSPNLPQDASAADRLASAQRDVADEAKALRDEIAALQAKLDAMRNGEDGERALDEAARRSDAARDASQELADAFSSNPDWDGQKDENAPTRQSDGDPNAQRDWDGQKDENAPTRQAEGDPNAQRNWDGQKDENAPMRQAEGDPNAQRNWDGKKDPNSKDDPSQQGNWDPDAKNRPPWDGKIDPNAMQNAADQMKGAADALRRAGEDLRRQGEEARQRNAELAQQALDAMRQASEAARNQQQGGEQQQQGGDQQQGQQQQGGDQQQGQQQQGGDQQQGQQQQGGDQQQGGQQQGQQQNGPADQARKAADAMRDLAGRMKEQSGSQNQEGGESDQDSESDSQDGPESQSSSSKNGKSKGKHSQSNVPEGGVPELLRSLGLEDLDWFKSRSSGGGERIDAEMENVPPEYRDLVRSYFDALRSQDR